MGLIMEDLQLLITEQRNPLTTHIDTVSSLEMVTMMNEENKKVAAAIDCILPFVAQAIERVAANMKMGGRLIYVGAGTSGRLGVLDASECPPTFGVSSDMVMALMAGGRDAIFNAAEGNEDDYDTGYDEIQKLAVSGNDTIVGIAASGRTPYVLGAMKAAHEHGCTVLSICCNPGSIMDQEADFALSPCVGPEVIAGSTRLKSGTAQKMILNMLSTGVMIRLGKVYENLMVNAHVSNSKGNIRLKGILQEITNCTVEEANSLFQRTDGNVAEAIRLYHTGEG
jgi:N-acetylmuramic acid 6-phosphate etherase